MSSLPTFSLRTSPYMPPVVNQGSALQTCVPCAVTNAIKFYDNRNGIIRDYRSRIYIFYYSRILDKTPGQNVGVTMPSVSTSISNYGIPSELLTPYPNITIPDQVQLAQANKIPTRPAYADAKKNTFVKFKVVSTDLRSIKDILAVKKYPIVCVIRVFTVPITPGSKTYVKSLTYAQTNGGNIPYPGTCYLRPGVTDPTFKACYLKDGHCLLIVGWDDVRKVFIVQNSYGTAWGNGGYGTIPYAYITNANLASRLYTMY